MTRVVIPGRLVLIAFDSDKVEALRVASWLNAVLAR